MKTNAPNGIIEQILVAEDSPTQAEQLKHILEQHNFNVIVAKNGKEALSFINKKKPSLVISDIVMPEMDGFELCKEIKSNEKTQEIPVILLTSLSRSEDVMEALSCGADNFLTKPYSENYLFSLIDQILVNKKFRQEERVRVGVEITFGGKRRFITANQQQMLTLLISTYEAAVQRNNELLQTQDELQSLNEHLEEIVTERTSELTNEIEIRKLAEIKINKLNRIYAVLSNINQAIVRIHETRQLLKDCCLIAVDEGKFQCASIGMINDETGKIETSATAGLANNLIEASLLQNPILNVLKTGKHFISNIISSDKNLKAEWKKESLAYGFASFAALPIKVQGKVAGTFCIFSNEVCFFDELEISLLDELATDISFALEYIHIESEHKRAEKEIYKLNEELEQRVIDRTSLLESANKELEAFSYSVSHDLRAPLRAISGFSQILMQDYKDSLDEEGRKLCSLVVNNASRMGQLIDDLLEFSHVGRSDISHAIIKMEDLVNQVFAELSQDLKKENLNFSVQKIPDCVGDITLIRQVWTNLLSNAIKYSSTREHPVISVGFEQKNAEIVYYIKDNGVGFDMQYADKLFGVFQRLHSAKEFQGTGVGLAIVQRIIRRHLGKVWAVAEVENGATFYFSIPLNKL